MQEIIDNLKLLKVTAPAQLEEMLLEKRWIAWASVSQDKGKLNKVILSESAEVLRTKRGKATCPRKWNSNDNLWMTFDDAVAHLEKGFERSRGEAWLACGVGFVFVNTKYAVIDIDDCVHIRDAMNALNREHVDIGIIETSPSKTGLHIWGKFEGRRNITTSLNGVNFELITNKRWCTFTADFVAINEDIDLTPLTAPLLDSKRELGGIIGLDTNLSLESTERLELIFKGQERGSRNATTFVAGIKLREQGLSEDDALQRLLALNALRKEPLQHEEVLTCLRSVFSQEAFYKKELREAEELFEKLSTNESESNLEGQNQETMTVSEERLFLDDSDLGNSRELLEILNEQAIYCQENKSWSMFDGTKWEHDCTAKIREIAKLVPALLLKKGYVLSNEKEMKRWSNHVKKSKSAAAQRNMVELAASAVTESISLFDTHKTWHLLNFADGVYNLEDGSFSPHSPTLRTTAVVGSNRSLGIKGCAYPQEFTTSEQWSEFVDWVVCGQKDYAIYLQKLVGSTLLGGNREQKFIMCQGDGLNGKSTFFDVIGEVLGDDYKGTLDGSAFIQTRYESSHLNNELASVMSARLVVASEIPDRQKFDDKKIKQISGGEQVIVCPKYKDAISFRPAFTVFQLTNFEPQLATVNTAITRRLIKLPFDATLDPSDVDPELKKRLLLDKQSILCWLLDGYWMYRAEGLGECEAVKEATQSYVDEEDHLSRFVEGSLMCVNGHDLPSNKLYSVYKNWCEENHITYPSAQNTLSKELKRRGFKKKRGKNGIIWVNISVIENTIQVENLPF